MYLARWYGTDVAVKCLSPSLLSAGRSTSGSACADAVAELMKEASMLACLHHPNIVSVFGVVLPPSELLNTTISGSHAAAVAAAAAAVGDSFDDCHLLEQLSLTMEVNDSSGQSTQGSNGGSLAARGLDLTMLGRSALSQGHPPAPAVVTEYLAAGSLRSAISNKADWLRSNMAKVKLLLDTARVRQMQCKPRTPPSANRQGRRPVGKG